MKVYFLSIIFISIALVSFSQDVNGYWQGVTYQDDCGQTNTFFPLSIVMTQTGDIVDGEYRVEVVGSADYAVYVLSNSTFDGSTFDFQLTTPREEFSSVADWCINIDASLTYDAMTETLIGPWTGEGSSILTVCCPGTIELYRLAVLSETTYCIDEEINLEVTGQDIRWYADEELDNLVATGNVFSPSIDQSTTFFVTQTHYNTESPSVPVEVIITKPDIEDISANPLDCNLQNGMIIVTATGNGPLNYSLDSVNFQSDNIFQDLSANNYTVFVQDADGCIAVANTEIVAAVSPNIDLESSIPASCEENNGTLSLEGTEGLPPYEYSIDGVSFQTDNTFSDLVAGNYSISIRDANGCSNSGMFEVELDNPSLVVTAISILEANCGLPNGQFGVEVQGGVGTISTSLNNGDFTPSLVFGDLAAGTYAIRIMDETECPLDTFIIIPELECSVYIPNIFSPNGDGINDQFQVFSYSEFNGVIDYLRIYDRWGGLIYEEQNLGLDQSGWDGRFNGDLVKEGIYAYAIQISYDDGSIEKFSGCILLVE